MKIGKLINKAHAGKTNQMILLENSTILAVSCVSTYIHIMASTDTSGIEAKMAPITELLLDISEMATIRSVVIMILVI